MSTRVMLKKLDQLQFLLSRRQVRGHKTLARLRARPTAIMSLAGFRPDPWQQRLLASAAPGFLLLCSRQSGKSTAAAAMALRTALLEAGATILLLSPSQRQSDELFRKVQTLFAAVGRPLAVIRDSALQLELSNGSRVISLPGSESTVRCFGGVRMLVIDEAARVADELYCAVRPMLAVSRGQLVALSTPFGKRGWFFEAWQSSGSWERIRVTAQECPRISSDFLREERLALGQRWYAQEYECSFEETVGAVFRHDDIVAAMTADLPPLFAEERP